MLSNCLMSLNLKKLIVFIFTVHLVCWGGFAQSKTKKFTQELFAELRENEKLVAEWERKALEYQITNFGRALPRVSGHCFDGCPVRVVLPYYPREAKRLGIFGVVKVETIVDENGDVIYARTVKDLPFLSQAAE